MKYFFLPSTLFLVFFFWLCAHSLVRIQIFFFVCCGKFNRFFFLSSEWAYFNDAVVVVARVFIFYCSFQIRSSTIHLSRIFIRFVVAAAAAKAVFDVLRLFSSSHIECQMWVRQHSICHIEVIKCTLNACCVKQFLQSVCSHDGMCVCVCICVRACVRSILL